MLSLRPSIRLARSRALLSAENAQQRCGIFSHIIFIASPLSFAIRLPAISVGIPTVYGIIGILNRHK